MKFFLNILFILVCFIFSGCADKKYISVANSDANSTDESETLSGSDCKIQFSKSQLCLSWYWEEVPVVKKTMGKLVYKVFRKNNVDGSVVLVDVLSAPFVFLFMPSMGHGSRPVITTHEDVGTYRVQKIFFSMGGDWEIKIQFKENEIVVDEAVITLFL